MAKFISAESPWCNISDTSKAKWWNFEQLAESLVWYPGKIIETNLLFSTVSSSENKVISDESSSTEPGVINHQSNYPGPLVLLSLESSNNPLTSGIMSIILNTTDIFRNIIWIRLIDKFSLPSKFLKGPSCGFGSLALNVLNVLLTLPCSYLSDLGLILDNHLSLINQDL